jgi:hypothetical protein
VLFSVGHRNALGSEVMLAKFRDRFGAMPVWLVLPLGLVWGVLAIFFWICAGVWIVARFATQHVQQGWRAWQVRRAA